MGDSITLMFKAFGSGRFFRNRKGSGPENSPLIGPPSSDDEGVGQTTP